MAKTGNTMWNGNYGAEETTRRKNYQRMAGVVDLGRARLRKELREGKKKFESSLPEPDIAPIQMDELVGAIKDKSK